MRRAVVRGCRASVEVNSPGRACLLLYSEPEPIGGTSSNTTIHPYLPYLSHSLHSSLGT
jgi:hypothetical protein